MKVLALLPLCLALASCDNEPAPVPVPARIAEPAPAVEAHGANPAVPKQLLSLDELLKGPDGSKPIFLIDGRRVTADEVDNILLSKVERIEKMDPGNPLGKLYGAGDGAYVINVVMKK